MSVNINMETQGEDLPALLEWLAEVLKNHPTARWSLQLQLEVIPKKDC